MLRRGAAPTRLANGVARDGGGGTDGGLGGREGDGAWLLLLLGRSGVRGGRGRGIDVDDIHGGLVVDILDIGCGEVRREEKKEEGD